MNGKQLKNSILQWAIQGKLVPQDPNDEPASVLLERIREEKTRLVKEKKIKKDKNESIIFRGDDNSHYEKFADGTVKCIDDEIPFEIPQSWCWVRFGSLVVHNPQVTADDETNAAFMPMTLIDAGYGSSYTYETQKWGTIKTGFTKIATGDIAYAKITPCFQNRKSFILGEVPGGVAAATTELNVIRTYADTLDEWYILYFLKSEYFIKEARYKGTAGQQRVLSDYVQSKLVPLPPLNEQKRIVQKMQEALPIVRTYGKSQEALDKLNAEIYDKLKKSVLQEAIQGKLVPQCPNDEPASVLLERIRTEKTKLFKECKLKKKDLVDSVIFKGDDNKYYETINGVTECIEEEIPYDLPSNWAWTRLGNVAKMTIGKTPARGDQRFWSNGEYSWVSISDMKDLGVISVSKERISAIAAKELMGNISPKGSLLMSFKLTVGRTSLLDIDAYHNEAIITIQPFIDEQHSLRDYLFRTLPQLSTSGDSKDAIKGKTLNSQSLSKLLIPLAPLNEQKRITKELLKFDDVCR